MQREGKDIFQIIFHPESIAIFGASSNRMKSGFRYLNELIRAGFRGRIYPINPKEKEILGIKAYPSILECPESVDYAIFSVPARDVPRLIEECGQNGVKAIQLFTAGFRETGDPEGIYLEEEMVRIAKKHRIRIIGPNCIGIYCPESRIPYGPVPSPMEPGEVGFFSQSGGHAGRLITGGSIQGIRFSKVISYGNGCDLNAVDFLKYLGSDEKTRIIGAYLEGIEWSKPFFHLTREISKNKPIVIWKGGQTPQGVKTLLSHTGSIAGSYHIWEDALKQCGALVVKDFEELSDTLLALSKLKGIKGKRLIIATGLIGGGGGISVEGTDIAIQEGLDLINLSKDIQNRILKCLPRRAGTILSNPIDLGSPMEFDVLKRVLKICLTETDVDIIFIQEFFDRLIGSVPEGSLLSLFSEIYEMGMEYGRPIVIIWPPEASGPEGISLRLKIIEKGILVLPSMRRAARAVFKVVQYRRINPDF
jgi:acyl-CoA synthetase (NDP forming)